MTQSPKKGNHGFSCNLIPRLLVPGNEVNSCAVLTAYMMMLALLQGALPLLFIFRLDVGEIQGSKV